VWSYQSISDALPNGSKGDCRRVFICYIYEIVVLPLFRRTKTRGGYHLISFISSASFLQLQTFDRPSTTADLTVYLLKSQELCILLLEHKSRLYLVVLIARTKEEDPIRNKNAFISFILHTVPLWLIYIGNRNDYNSNIKYGDNRVLCRRRPMVRRLYDSDCIVSSRPYFLFILDRYAREPPT
jgi:hypothetical protein